jgi:hypothetical protein
MLLRLRLDCEYILMECVGRLLIDVCDWTANIDERS